MKNRRDCLRKELTQCNFFCATSLNENGTLRNGDGLCAGVVESVNGMSGGSDTIEMGNCVADLVGYEGVESESLKRQTWNLTEDSRLMTTFYSSGKNDNYCLGSVIDDSKMSDLKLNKPVSLSLVDCFDNRDSFAFVMPERKDFQERIDSYCNNVAKQKCSNQENSHVLTDMTLVARYDEGINDADYDYDETKEDDTGVSGLVGGSTSKKWRCYNVDALVDNMDGTYGNYKRKNNIHAMQYCDQNLELREILKDALGVEPFDEFTKRVIRLSYIRFNRVADDLSYYVDFLVLLLGFVSMVLR